LFEIPFKFTSVNEKFKVSVVALICFLLGLFSYNPIEQFFFGSLVLVLGFSYVLRDLKLGSLFFLIFGFATYFYFFFNLSNRINFANNSFRNFHFHSFLILLLLLVVYFQFTKFGLIDLKYISISVIVAVVLMGPTIFKRDNQSILSSLLLQYDFNAHFYILKSLAFCDSSLAWCFTNNSKTIPINNGIVSYPFGFHALFAFIFKSDLLNLQYAILTFQWIVLFTIFFTLLVTFKIFEPKRGFGKTGRDRNGAILSYVISAVFAGVPIYFLMMGWINSTLAGVFFSLGFYFMKTGNFNLGFTCILFSSIIWSFIFLIATPYLFISYLLSKQNRLLSTNLIAILYAYLFIEFIAGSLSSNSDDGVSIPSNHFVEPLIFLILLIATTLRLSRNVKAQCSLVALSSPILCYWMYLLVSKHIFSSYYLVKASLFMILALAMYLYVDLFLESNLISPNNTSCLSSNLAFSLSFISILIFTWFPFGAGNRILGMNVFPNVYTGSEAIYYKWNLLDQDKKQAELLIKYLDSDKTIVARVILDDFYWYRGTQWFNVIKGTWSGELQACIDSIRVLNSGDASKWNLSMKPECKNSIEISDLRQMFLNSKGEK